MYKNITATQMKEFLDKHKDIILVDTRTPMEFEEEHIKGAILIPFDQLAQRHEEMKAKKHDKIILYCRTGSRSAYAAQVLSDLGYEDVSNEMGGILDWIENGYPISR